MNTFDKTTVYNLKRQFGIPIQVCRITSSVTDRETGLKTVSRSTISVQRAIQLPNELIRQFFSRDQLAKFGGYIDVSKRIFAIAVTDLPSNYQFNPEDWVISQDKRYDLELISDYPGVIILIGNEVVGGQKWQIINESARQMLVVGQSTTRLIEKITQHIVVNDFPHPPIPPP